MAGPPGYDKESLFDQLRSGRDPKVEAERARLLQAEEAARVEAQQRYLSQIAQGNSTLPIHISSVHVQGAEHVRRGFLQRIFKPLLQSDPNQQPTLADALSEISDGVQKLQKLDIFHHPISVSIARPDPSDPSTTPNDLDVYLAVKEKSKLLLKTGTDVGNAEGSAYLNVLARNIFGGAETLNANASLGTRTRSEYSASYESPILSDPDFRWQFGGVASATQKPWASHEEVLKGAWTKLRYATRGGSRHEIGYDGTWRQVTGLTDGASKTVRGDAGDSVKSSVYYGWTLDKRDNPLLPTQGSLARTVLELAGWGPLAGDVAFGKAQVEAQTATSVPIPGINGKSGVTVTTGFRAGLMQPLRQTPDAEYQKTRVNDRFQLGGPTDVRGFRLSGLGPHDGRDAVGGNAFVAGSANFLFPLPRVDSSRPIRFQTFITGGRLLSLPNPSKASSEVENIKQAIASSVGEIGNGLPSMSAGFGLVYAAPMARFELNFSLPLVIRKGEEGRKGLSFGIGINMM